MTQAADTETTELTDLELQILDVERAWWKHVGAKEGVIRDRFDISPTRYYQLLNALIDKPAAIEADPLLVARLRRLRAARKAERSKRSANRTRSP